MKTYGNVLCFKHVYIAHLFMFKIQGGGLKPLQKFKINKKVDGLQNVLS